MATITTRKGYRVLNWTDQATDKRKHTSLAKVGILSAAQERDILRIKEYELSTGARLLNAHRRPAPRFDHFVRGYKLWHQGEYPDSTYRIQQIIDDHLEPHFGVTPLNLISIQQAEDYKTKRRPLVKAWTLAKELRVLHAVINRAVEIKAIDDNPISAVKDPQILDSKPHEWFSAAQLAKLYRQSDYGPVWKLFANTGLRRGEGLILRSIWCMPKKIRVVSTGEERTKAGEWREIPRTAGATEALAALKAAGAYVLPRIAKESLSRACARDLRAAGLGGSLHTLRHTFICHMLLAGVPVRTVQLYAGHARMATTEKYAYQVIRNDPAEARKLSI